MQKGDKLKTLTEIRKTMSVKHHVEKSVNQYEFPSDLNLKDPYQKLAAGIIMQALIDACTYLDFTPMHKGVYEFYSGMINLNVPFEMLRDNMLVRIYVFGENVTRTFNGWTDRTRNTTTDMENNSIRRNQNGQSFELCLDRCDDFNLDDLYGGDCYQ